MAEQIKTTGAEVLGQYSSPADFDTCTATGLYKCYGNSALNGPMSKPYGALVVFKSNDDGYTVQLFVTKSNPVKLYFRIVTYPWAEVV